MKTINFDFKQDTEIFIHGQVWEPDSTVSGVIILVHGLGEHSGRYSSHFADYFTQQGFAIVTFDLPGHGKSGGKRGHINQYDDFSKLVSSGVSYTKSKYLDLPIFVYGHSLGGLIALEYIIKHKPEINGAIITAPVIDVNEPIPPVKVALAKILDKFFPSFVLDSGLNRNMLSRDISVIEKYNSDPLVHGMTSSRLGMYIINIGEYVKNNAKQISIPTLLMVGSAEGIVSKSAIDNFCQQADKCQEKVWPGLYHELHNEPEQLEVFKYTYKWMQVHS